ncbi:hypothetical protein ACF06W_11365 [Streptomyces albus]|uniref:hypothetical protein n=1 Tax=Streptomyces albus TaxID=1888 RepID=UPI003701E967
MQDLVPAVGDCPLTRPCGLPVADLVGHTRAGHQTARRLAAKGFKTVPQVLELASVQGLDLFLGDALCARLEAALRS